MIAKTQMDHLATEPARFAEWTPAARAEPTTIFFTRSATIADDEEEDGDDDRRDVEEDDALEERIHLLETQDIESGDQEHDNDEPLHELAEESADMQVIAGVLHDVVHARRFERVIDAQYLHDLLDDLREDHADDPSDEEDDDRREDVRDERDDREPHVLERCLEDVSRLGNYHTKSYELLSS